MSEATLRVLILAGIAVAVAGSVFWQRRVKRARPVPVFRPDLGEGVHFFASATCQPCFAARDALRVVYGEKFSEISYEADPTRFGELGISSVPTVMVLDATGQGLLWEGVPRPSDLPVSPPSGGRNGPLSS